MVRTTSDVGSVVGGDGDFAGVAIGCGASTAGPSRVSPRPTSDFMVACRGDFAGATVVCSGAPSRVSPTTPDVGPVIICDGDFSGVVVVIDGDFGGVPVVIDGVLDGVGIVCNGDFGGLTEGGFTRITEGGFGGVMEIFGGPGTRSTALAGLATQTMARHNQQAL